MGGHWGDSSSECESVILHWDGTGWTEIYRDTVFSLEAVWGLASNDVYAAGFWGVILHWDGNFWSRVQCGTDKKFSGLWGTGNEIWVVSNLGGILHHVK